MFAGLKKKVQQQSQATTAGADADEAAKGDDSQQRQQPEQEKKNQVEEKQQKKEKEKEKEKETPPSDNAQAQKPKPKKAGGMFSSLKKRMEVAVKVSPSKSVSNSLAYCIQPCLEKNKKERGHPAAARVNLSTNPPASFFPS